MRNDLDKTFLRVPTPQPLGRARGVVDAHTARVLPLLGVCTEDFLRLLAKVYTWPLDAAARAELERRAKLEA